ncbi:MAG: [FeFe] hydrogenase H-cluster maturation GTPase HydF [Candidatus Cloacimonadota bacterium]|nr:MAG: [FeFe] hydrogenase H-cluster maturation GTPase HydF [Candidatus Cloacimonadota bacterium]PIE78844.1 MAG: [FeFe] hydrogenase H-cluster maturation GTPase HydF [Candidatus Delongbacteria bacterium]
MGKNRRPHIGIFGRRNNGKSSLINALSGQDIAIVSNFAGTTTDPVKKVMEIPGIGPVVLIDTAGIDDTGELGALRIKKSFKTIKHIDLGIIVTKGNEFDIYEEDLIERFKKLKTPFIIVHNRSDEILMKNSFSQKISERFGTEPIQFSAIFPKNREELIRKIKKSTPESSFKSKSILGDIVKYGDIVILVTPIDIEAPEGRLILPQVQTIRDLLDNDCIAVVVKERELDLFLKQLKNPPALVVTDSQEFLKVGGTVPNSIPLTSFSILLARLKGDFDKFLEGTPYIDKLKDGDNVLILESCTHHVSCDDIGRVKIPRWLSSFTGKKLNFDVVSGLDDIEKPIEEYSLVVQCGGCVITDKQLQNRLKPAIDKGIPVSNYGMAISYCHGIFKRAIKPFSLNKTDDISEYL